MLSRANHRIRRTGRIDARALRLRQAAPVAFALAVPLLTFGLLLRRPDSDALLGSPTSHFYVVSLIAALAMILAIAVVWAARRLPDSRTFFLAMGFLSMATIFLAHGLGTSPFFGAGHNHGDAFSAYGPGVADDDDAPGYGATTEPVAAPTAFDPTYGYGGGSTAAAPSAPVDHSGHTDGTGTTPAAADGAAEAAAARGLVVGYSAQLSLFLSAIFFALATIGLPVIVQDLIVKHWVRAILLLSLPLLGHVYVALAQPTLISGLPLDSDPVRWTIAAAAVACLAFAGMRFFQAYRLVQLPLQAAMALGMGLLIEAQLFMLEGRLWRLSWWEYHLVMLAGFAICVGALLRQYRMTGDLGAIVEGLFLRERVSGLRAGDPRALVALSAAVAAKDTETAGHTERVAELTVAIGNRLGVAEERIEILRLAGRLHDVGKIGVPTNILRKPGGLTPTEFDAIKQHTVRGWRLANRSEMLANIAPIIRAHHERLDGGGYPDGLRGKDIPFEARIVAAADVWDALTSDRPYRKAMDWDQAADIITKSAGPHLEPRCVQALFEELGIPSFQVPRLGSDAA